MRKGVVYMLGASLAFSFMQLCVKYLPHLPAVELVFFRSLVSISICLVMMKKLKLNPLGNNRKILLMRGVFGTIALSMFFYTLQQIPLASAVTIQYLSPIFTALFAAIFLKEKMKLKQWIYFGIAFGGVALLKGFDERVSLGFMLVGIVSAMFSGIAYTCIRKLKETDHPLVVVFYFPLIATPIMGVLSYFQWVKPIGKDWLLLLLMGVFTQIAQVLMTKGLQSAAVNKIISVKYIGTFWALAFGYILFGESYSWLSIVGILLVMVGVVLNLKTKSGKL